MKSFKQFNEEKRNEIVFTFGRFNPPTVGHEKLIRKVASEAIGNSYRVYASQSNDPKRNPLEYKEKIAIMRKMFPKHGRNIIEDKNAKTVLHIASALYDQGFTKIKMVVGSDRVSEFQKLLKKYNQVKGRHGFYDFEHGIEIVSAGERDPDSDDVSGMSASKMRAAAENGDFKEFSKGLTKAYGEDMTLFNLIRKRMGLKEMTNFRKHVQLEKVSDKREQYISGEIFNIGDQVWTESGDLITIKHRKPNYIIDSTDKKHFVEKLNPAYGKDLSKSTKAKRQAQFNKQAKMDDDDPRAYKPAPGDARGKTKLSKHTIAYRKRFGEFVEDDHSGPCWKTHKMVGMKKKKGYPGMVPDCVPREEAEKRTPRKKGQHTGSSSHSDLYTDEDPKGTIHGLGFKDAATANKGIEIITASDRTHAHKVQATLVMQQRAKVAIGKTKDPEKKKNIEAAYKIWSDHLEKLKAITKKKNEALEVGTDEYADKYKKDTPGQSELSEKQLAGLKKKADESGISYGILKKVFDRGMAAWKTGHRPGATPHQWAYARVNSFITGGKTRTTADKDLWAKHKGKKESLEEAKCPPATQDLKINTKNRDATIKQYNYGPLNVDEPGDYWKDIAKYWKTTVAAAKKSLCANCVAFDISERMKDCMPGETSDKDGELGYCWMHHFKCHSARACHTWAKGGPIKDDKKSLDWQSRSNITEGEGKYKGETWEQGFKRRVVKTTSPDHIEKGYAWRIKGKERDEISIKLYKKKPDFKEYVKQMKRVAGHEFGA